MRKQPKKVFVVGASPFVQKMFADNSFRVVYTPGEADVLCWTGGADVNPELYGQSCHPTTWFDVHRDTREQHVYDTNPDKFKVGICRGGQFLNVLSGGDLYQDVNNHAISGTHIAKDTRHPRGEYLDVTSTHHQMMRTTDDGIILLTAALTTRRETDISVELGPFDYTTDPDVEAVWYQHTRSLCFQPHPEYVDGKLCRSFFFNLIKELY